MAKSKNKGASRTDPVIENRRARHEYFISETLETGIVLGGSEVKSVRAGEVSLGEGYVRVEGEPPELSLIGVTIGEYAPAGPTQHRTNRSRRLLANRREIRKLAKAVEAKGTTIVPLKLYFTRGLAKLLIGVAHGKSREDKRQTIAERETKRDIQRVMSKRVGRGGV